MRLLFSSTPFPPALNPVCYVKILTATHWWECQFLHFRISRIFLVSRDHLDDNNGFLGISIVAIASSRL